MPDRWWKVEAIPVLSYDSLAKYMGVRIDPALAIILPRDKWDDWFSNVNTAPLKPEKKYYAIKTCILLECYFSGGYWNLQT